MQSIKAILKEGHKVASGQANDSPYPEGSIKMQAPYFKKHGVNLDSYYLATLNLSISPYRFEMVSPEFTVQKLEWAESFPAEDFSFSKCEVLFNKSSYKGLIYYPHPETKIAHFHDQSLIEVIVQYIPNIEYGDELELVLNNKEIKIEK